MLFTFVLLAHRPELLANIGSFLFGSLKTSLGCVVLLTRKGVDFNLKLASLSFQCVESFGLRLASDSDCSCSLIDQIDRRIRESASRQVARSESSGSYDSSVKNVDTVVSLVFFLQTTKNRDGFWDCRFLDKDLLESSLEGLVLLNILAVFREGRGTNTMELTASQHGLEKVSSIHTAFTARSSAHKQVDFIDEENNGILGIFNFLENALHTFFEFTAVFAARNKRTNVEREKTALSQVGRNIGIDNTASETFDNGGLTHTGLTDKHGVVLCASTENANDATDLLLTANDRIDLTLPSQGSHINGELLQVLILSFRISGLGVDPFCTTNLLDSSVDQLEVGNIGITQGTLNL